MLLRSHGRLGDLPLEDEELGSCPDSGVVVRRGFHDHVLRHECWKPSGILEFKFIDLCALLVFYLN